MGEWPESARSAEAKLGEIARAMFDDLERRVASLAESLRQLELYVHGSTFSTPGPIAGKYEEALTEEARVDRWHATRDAVLTGLLSNPKHNHMSDDDTRGLAHIYADRVHGPLEAKP